MSRDVAQRAALRSDAEVGQAILGIDVGGTKILGGLVSPEGEVFARHELPTRSATLIDDVLQLVRRLSESSRQDITHVGIGSKGLVDRGSGTLIRSQGLGVENVRFAECIQAETGLAVIVDNDVHAATIGEIYFGAGRRYKDFFLYNAGTGLAAGLVFDGHLHRGASNNAGEVGEMPIDQRAATVSSYGLHGCAEGLVHDARRGLETPPVNLPRSGPPPRIEYGYIALNIIQLLNVINPAAIVLAGGMFNRSEHGTAWVREAVLAHALPAAVRALEFFGMSETAPVTGLVGAAALVLEVTNGGMRKALPA